MCDTFAAFCPNLENFKKLSFSCVSAFIALIKGFWQNDATMCYRIAKKYKYYVQVQNKCGMKAFYLFFCFQILLEFLCLAVRECESMSLGMVK